MINPVIIIGTEALAISAQDIFVANGIPVYGFLDDDEKKHGQLIEEVSILGSPDDDGMLKLIGKKCSAFVGVTSVKERIALVKMLREKRKVMPTNAIHPKSTIAVSAIVTHGLCIHAGVVIESRARINEHVIIHSNATIETGANLDQYVQVGAASIVGHNTKIGAGTFIGPGCTIAGEITIEENVRIGAGSVVVDNVKKGETVFGNPAKPIKL
jgi:sugar O-acyltransferase (sialic acid O-acetyltransferase NeuD family)